MKAFVQTTPRLRSIRPVLRRWISLHRQYLRYWAGKDCGWWYNERTSIGFLAVAAWGRGEVALEEYSTPKGGKSVDYVGRCDLYFTRAPNDFVVEAKQAWINLGAPGTGIPNVKAQLKKACRDARLARDNVTRRLGVVFCVPRFVGNAQGVQERALDSWLKSLSMLKLDALCWIGAPRNYTLRGHDGYIYPGVALIARLVK